MTPDRMQSCYCCEKRRVMVTAWLLGVTTVSSSILLLSRGDGSGKNSKMSGMHVRNTESSSERMISAVLSTFHYGTRKVSKF